MVPVTIWLIVAGAFLPAFIVFLLAGISDGVDGFIARQFKLQTELGSYIDPLADKLLLVGIYMSLGFLQHLPAWLVILVVSRDVFIVGGLMLAWLIGKPIKIHPVLVSKINTTIQILLAGMALGLLAFDMHHPYWIIWGSVLAGIFTVASGAIYMQQWLLHMSNGNSIADDSEQM